MEPTLKKYFEIFLVIFLWWIIIHTILYFYYFTDFCNKYSWNNEKNYIEAISKLSTCKDSLICESINIESNSKNEVNNWSCIKKDTWFIYINMFNNFKNSIIK